jgi:hypothetical protein
VQSVTGPRTTVAALLAGAALIAGCGSSSSGSSDATHIKQTITTAFSDLASGNGAGFCGLATTAGQQTLAKALPGATCAKVVTLVSQHLSAQQKAGLQHATVKNVTVKGNTATIKNADITTSQGTLKGFLSTSGQPTMLTKQSDGTWKLSG